RIGPPRLMRQVLAEVEEALLGRAAALVTLAGLNHLARRLNPGRRNLEGIGDGADRRPRMVADADDHVDVYTLEPTHTITPVPSSTSTTRSSSCQTYAHLCSRSLSFSRPSSICSCVSMTSPVSE